MQGAARFLISMQLTADLPGNFRVKKIENRSRFDRIVVMSLWPRFLAHPVVWIRSVRFVGPCEASLNRLLIAVITVACLLPPRFRSSAVCVVSEITGYVQWDFEHSYICSGVTRILGSDLRPSAEGAYTGLEQGCSGAGGRRPCTFFDGRRVPHSPTFLDWNSCKS